MARRPLVLGNWKMNLQRVGALELARALLATRELEATPVEVGVCPSHVHLAEVGALLRSSEIGLGGQDCVAQAPGAVTGGSSAEQLAEVGCRWVLLGHSERRQFFGEDEAGLRPKLAAARRAGLAAVLCVGETLGDRQAGRTRAVVGAQFDGALEGSDPSALAGLTVAYEPVWAIGTGHNAEPDDIQAVHAFLRQRLRERGGEAAAARVRILYGGSVKPSNIAATMACPDVDGALVGGASLEAAGFAAIVQGAAASI